MECPLCELEGLPATNTGICSDCWGKMNTSSKFEGKSFEIDISDDSKRQQLKLKQNPTIIYKGIDSINKIFLQFDLPEIEEE